MVKTPMVDEQQLQAVLRGIKSEDIKNVHNIKRMLPQSPYSVTNAESTKQNQKEHQPEVENLIYEKSTIAPLSRKQAKEEYARKFLGKQQHTSRKIISISDDVYQKLTYIHACLMKKVTLTALIGHIIEDHIDTYRGVIKDISKDTSNSINL